MSFVAAQAASTPNVIIIMADDQGYQDLGCFGSPKIKTPHIDRMAKEGMRFTDFYSGASVCTPSRAALLTGCYAKRVGGLGVLFPRDKRCLNPDEITIESLSMVLAEPPTLLVIGCGDRFVPPSQNLLAALKEPGVALEWMDTGAACRTFNVLLTEDRAAMAALIAVE